MSPLWQKGHSPHEIVIISTSFGNALLTAFRLYSHRLDRMREIASVTTPQQAPIYLACVIMVILIGFSVSQTGAAMGDDKRKSDDTDRAKAPAPDRPQVDLHDPFSRFEFEPTDGGEF